MFDRTGRTAAEYPLHRSTRRADPPLWLVLCDNPRMRFKTGLFIGFVIGFMVGARAGKERYDRIVASMRSVMQNDRVQQATDIAERSTRKSRAAAGSGLVTAADKVRERTAAQ